MGAWAGGDQNDELLEESSSLTTRNVILRAAAWEVEADRKCRTSCSEKIAASARGQEAKREGRQSMATAMHPPHGLPCQRVGSFARRTREEITVPQIASFQQRSWPPIRAGKGGAGSSRVVAARSRFVMRKRRGGRRTRRLRAGVAEREAGHQESVFVHCAESTAKR
jgi:hypothetical protein